MRSFFRSDIPELYNYVQSSMMVYPKEIIIMTLRDIFSKDSYYHFSKDKWGFVNTTDHTDLPLGADLPSGPGAKPELSLTEELSTRLFIGENFRQNAIMYPAILVKTGGSKYVPISINREKGSVQYEDILYEDGYGNSKLIKRPKYFITAGVWEGSINIDVKTRSLRARDDLVEIIMMVFSEISVKSIEDVGIIIKPPVAGSPSETDDRNDKLFQQTITLDIRSEWRRLIPVGNIIDAILFTIDFQNLENPNSEPAPNLRIITSDTISDFLLKDPF